MKRVRIPFFSKLINLKQDIPVNIDNSQFFVRMDFDRKHDLVYFFIKLDILSKIFSILKNCRY